MYSGLFIGVFKKKSFISMLINFAHLRALERTLLSIIFILMIKNKAKTIPETDRMKLFTRVLRKWRENWKLKHISLPVF